MFQTPGTVLRRNQPRIQHLVNVPAPIGGLNTRDALASMSPQDAVSLVNWIPDTYGVRARKGYTEWATNFPSGNPVQSVFSYIAPATPIPAGTFLTVPTSMPGKLFAATKAAIYDITSSTNAPAQALALAGSANSGWFTSSIFSNSGGSYILAASEDDGYFTYDGTTWLKIAQGTGANQVSNVDPATFCHVCVWKRRPWFVQKNTTKAWYLGTDSIYGAATSFDFGPLFAHGGALAYLANWTIDAGDTSIDNYLVVVSTNGDVLVYKGTDPSSAATFALVGSWYVGQIPVGRRAYSQLGGDLIIVSAEGIFPMSWVTRGGAALLQASSKEYASKIRPTIGQDLRASFTLQGWQMALHPTERILLVNVPNYTGVMNKQYAMSVTLHDWSIFQDIPILSLGSTMGYTFSGTQDGRVLLLFNGFLDNVKYGTTNGNSIRGIIMPAFSTFPLPNLAVSEKHFLSVRPNFLCQNTPSVYASINTNYSILQPQGAVTLATVQGSVWDVNLWDSAIWGGGLSPYSVWTSVGGVGFAGAAALLTYTNSDSILTSIDYMMELGGPI